MIIPFADTDVELLAAGALWVPSSRLLCVADMHLEKSSYFVPHATFLPPYGSLETLQKLEQILDQKKPDLFVAAGDSFHDRDGAMRLPSNLAQRLAAMIKSVPQWYWVSGNHDVTLADIISGKRCADLRHGGIVFRHEATDSAVPEVSGHYHPKVRMLLRGHRFSAPCFVRSKNRLVLPSFGQYTGGLDINSADFLRVIPREDRQIFVTHQDEVFAV